MRVLVWVLVATAACDTHENQCPGQLTCSSVCCPLGYPYHCGTQCYDQIPTTTQCTTGSYETCIDDSGGGGGGVGQYNGTYGGPCTSSDPGLPSQTMNVTLIVSDGVITSGAPNGGSVDASGLMSVTVVDRLGTPFPVTGHINVSASFMITGTTPNTGDATSVTCTLTKS